MAAKPKRVTYNDPVDDNADYLVPLRDDLTSTVVIQTKSSNKPPPPTGVFGSIFFPMTLLLYAGVPISQLVIGLIYIGQCPVRQFISTYMILSGIFGIACVAVGSYLYLLIMKQASSYENPRAKSKASKILIPIFVLLLLFVIGWWFTGQVIVFEVKLRVELFDPVLPEYCHPNLYKAAYILIFVDYLVFLIAIILNILSFMSPPPPETNHTITKRPTRNPRK